MRALLWILACTLLLAGPTVPIAAQGEEPGTGLGNQVEQGHFAGGLFRYEGTMQRFELYIPLSYERDKPLPLVILLHGATGMDGYTTARVLGFDDVADREGFYVLTPENHNMPWNTGNLMLNTANSDDVGYILGLLDAIIADEHVTLDTSRIFAVGPAAAGVMATLPVNLVDTCDGSAPVSVLLMHGTEDTDIRWDGMTGIYWGDVYQVLLSVPETVNFWMEHNGCDPERHRLQRLDAVDDGTAIRRVDYTRCVASTRVVFYAIEGGGHVWPGAQMYAGPAQGRASRELNATEVIWDFFTGIGGE